MRKFVFVLVVKNLLGFFKNVFQISLVALAMLEVKVKFIGRSSHAAAAPNEGINALVRMLFVVGGRRQHLN
jgi:metal-dependent amidase/aminoacylase/carboxypeptidase family protein